MDASNREDTGDLLLSHGLSEEGVDHNDGQSFRAMEWLMFFFRPPLPSMVFNDFDKFGPSPLNVFWGSNHWNQWFFDGFQNFEGNGQQWF